MPSRDCRQLCGLLGRFGAVRKALARTPMSPSRLLRLAVATFAAAWLGGAPTRAQDAAPPAAAEPSLPAFLDRLEAAFQTRDVSGWLAAREFETPEDRALEEETLRVWFASDEVVFTLLRRPTA